MKAYILMSLLWLSCGVEPIDDPRVIDWSFALTDGSGVAGFVYEGQTYEWPVSSTTPLAFQAPLYSDVFVSVSFAGDQHPEGHYVAMSNYQSGPYPDKWIAKWTQNGQGYAVTLRKREHVLAYPDYADPFVLTFEHFSPGDLEFTNITVYVIYASGKVRHLSVTSDY